MEKGRAKMRNFMISCLVAAFCIVQLDAVKIDPEKELKKLEEQLTNSKSRVNKIIRDISAYGNDLQSKYNSKLHARQEEDIKALYCNVNIELEKVCDLANGLNNISTYMEHCYRYAQVNFGKVMTNGYFHLDHCSKQAKTYLDEAHEFIHQFIMSGQSLLIELDAIFPSCHSKFPKTMVRCITRKLQKNEVSVKKFEDDSNSVKTKGNAAFDQSSTKATDCFDGVILLSKTALYRVQFDVDYCISKA